ncbi:hypothetical protein [Paenibacillus sp. Marseille-Q4541]|uniref:hypothetical protein n=1 Tax=Paenibacillus sp. Marseille-Q4541 TaxID=2831522 RepID=UPI001BA68D99|nr:hypothetical protein [Paenibacillus sp. Marseille-Q4541]
MMEELRLAEQKGYSVHLSLTDGTAYSGIVSLQIPHKKLRLKHTEGIISIPFQEIRHCSTLIPVPF